MHRDEAVVIQPRPILLAHAEAALARPRNQQRMRAPPRDAHCRATSPSRTTRSRSAPRAPANPAHRDTHAPALHPAARAPLPARTAPKDRAWPTAPRRQAHKRPPTTPHPAPTPPPRRATTHRT